MNMYRFSSMMLACCSLTVLLAQPSGARLQAPPLAATPAPTSATVVQGMNFDGPGQNSFGLTDTLTPPDPNGAVGASQYLEWVNDTIAIFNKATGALMNGPNSLAGPTPGATFWQSLGSGCGSGTSGDPIVEYDKSAARWVLAQPVLADASSLFCLAVSASSDATGSYSAYSFPISNSPESPKLAVWPDAYYVSFNLYNASNTLVGADPCAIDRNTILAGGTPTIQCFPQRRNVASLLPSDLDGYTAPPAGSPAYFMNLGDNSLNLWKFHVDFTNSNNSTFTGPISIPVTAFSTVCGGGACIPQTKTTQRLNSVGGSLMYRLAYRNFGDHESLVVNHSVKNGSSGSAVRWYEIRNPEGSPPIVYQQGTWAPDSKFRWMGSVAMDNAGDMVAGYSASSATTHPAISYAVRLPGDPLGQLETEMPIFAGTGSQTSGSTWGAYTSVSVDPVDDCTFWYTNEYLRSNGSLNWSTRVGSFSLASCTPVNTNPGIQLTALLNGFLYGSVTLPSSEYPNYKVATLLFQPGLGWYFNSCSPLFQDINGDGTFYPYVLNSPNDATATKYVSYLVPQSFQTSCPYNSSGQEEGYDGLPQDLEQQAVARAFFQNPPPVTVSFAGQTWYVSNSGSSLVNPGPCQFSDSPSNVSVDSQGFLHLAITEVNGTWYCAQVVSAGGFSWGTYTYQLDSLVDNLDPNVVVGLFTYSDDPVFVGAFSPWVNNPASLSEGGPTGSHGEVDIEFGNLGYNDGNNAQYAIQPAGNNGCLHRWLMPPNQPTSSHQFQWVPSGISYLSRGSNGATIQQWTSTCAVPTPADDGAWPGLVPSPQTARINVWLYGGQPPKNGQEVEIVIKGFRVTPANL